MNYKVGDIVPIYVYSLRYEVEFEEPRTCREMMSARVVQGSRGLALVPVGDFVDQDVPLRDGLYSFRFHVRADGGRHDRVSIRCVTPDPDYGEEFLRRCLDVLCGEVINTRISLGDLLQWKEGTK